MPEYRLHLGDCLDFLKSLPSGSVDAVVTDPPYGISFKSNSRKATPSLGSVANDSLPFVWWLWDAARALSDNGCMVVFHRWDVAEFWRQCIEAAGLEVKSQIIWSKGGGGMGDLRRQFLPSHEVAWFACKRDFAFKSGRPGTSVIDAPKVTPSVMVHPTEKPTELMSRLVRWACPEGGTVLDPFMGSGTTGIACVQTGRKFIGCEIDEKYVEIARRRIAEAVPLEVVT